MNHRLFSPKSFFMYKGLLVGILSLMVGAEGSLLWASSSRKEALKDTKISSLPPLEGKEKEKEATSSLAPKPLFLKETDSLADLVEPLVPTVVNISTSSMHSSPHMIPLPRLPFGGSPFMPFEDLQEFFEGMPDKLRKVKSAASGFFINAQGTILTNYHVVADAIPDGEIIVKLHDDTELPAKVVGFDKRVDIALLKVDVAKPVPFAVFGDAKKVRTGDRVITVGNPFGLGSTVTSGIVSYKSRDISSRSGIKVTEYVDDLIQTDASVNQGNSGGPLFNMKGEVIGINTAIYSPTGAHVGLAFAIPSNTVTPYIEQIQKFGKPRHGWIGVHIQPLTDEISENLGLPKGKGALVASIVPEGPAGKAGLKTGDVIVKFNDIDVKDSRRLPRMVGETVPGKAVPIVLWRDKKEVTCSVKVEDFEAAEEAGLLPGSSDTRHPEKGKMVFDMELHTLTREYRDRFDIRSNQKGVIITDIKRESQPWAKFIRPGDVIVAVDQTEVETPQDVSRLVDQARKKEKKSVLFLISRGDDLIFIALKLESKDQEKKEKTLKEGE